MHPLFYEIDEKMHGISAHFKGRLRNGGQLFLYALIGNIEQFHAERADDPHFQKWNAWMHELLDSPYDENEPSAFASLDEVWRFEAD